MILSGHVSCAEAEKVYRDYSNSSDRQGSGGFATVDGWNCAHDSVAGFRQSGQVLGCERGGDSFGTRSPGGKPTGQPSGSGQPGGGQVPPAPKTATNACGVLDNADMRAAGITGYLYTSPSVSCGEGQQLMNVLASGESAGSGPGPVIDGWTCTNSAVSLPSFAYPVPMITCTRGGGTIVLYETPTNH